MQRGSIQAVAAGLVFVLSGLTGRAVDAAEIKAGDQIVVARQNAPLMRGWSTLATLSQGQRLTVLQTQGPWVGVAVTADGRNVSGWLYNQQVATPDQYAAQRRTSRRRFSFQPGPVASSPPAAVRGNYGSGNFGSRNFGSSNRGLIMGDTPYGPSYWRADRKIKGE